MSRKSEQTKKMYKLLGGTGSLLVVFSYELVMRPVKHSCVFSVATISCPDMCVEKMKSSIQGNW